MSKRKVFIVGNQGNMGRRYAAILKYLGRDSFGMDMLEGKDYLNRNIEQIANSFDGIIIATPSETHMSYLFYLKDVKIPVLCEKPIWTRRPPDSFGNFQDDFFNFQKSRVPLTMVSQYDFLKHGVGGTTLYDFYRSGNDGLAWDCINLIWHAKGEIVLKNESPIWKCQINGRSLNLADMDYAYIEMIDHWLTQPYVPQYDRILKSHQKVLDYLNGKLN